MDLAGRSAHYGEVLAGEMNDAAVDSGTTRDYTIGRQFLARHAKVGGAVPRKDADLLKARLIDQGLDALARGELSRCVLLFNAVFAAAQLEQFPPRIEVGDLVLHGPWLAAFLLFEHPVSSRSYA